MSANEKRRIAEMIDNPEVKSYKIHPLKENIEKVTSEEYADTERTCCSIVAKLIFLAVDEMEKGLVGWEHSFEQGRCDDVFFIYGKDISRIDTEYIYDDYGYIQNNEDEDMKLCDLFEEGRSVYELVLRDQDLSEELSFSMDSIFSIYPPEKTRKAFEKDLQAAADVGLIVRMILKAGAHSDTDRYGKRTGAGTVLVSIRGKKMPLQIARFIKRFFGLDLIKRESRESITEDTVPICFARGMGYLANISHYVYGDKDEADDCDTCEEENKNPEYESRIGGSTKHDALKGESDEKEEDGDRMTFRIDEKDVTEEDMDPEKNVFITDIGDFSSRTRRCLIEANIVNLGQLSRLTESELKRIQGFNEKCMMEVKSVIKHYVGNAPEQSTIVRSKEITAKEELEGLVGLEEVKAQAKKITAFARMKKDFKGKTEIPMVLNMGFLGNPGSAKTTVARIMARFFHEAGLLESDQIVEVGRADLVAKYVGHTAVLVKQVFEKAEGKLLFIDEAYALTDGSDGVDFAAEAISAIVQEMENRREKTIVIFAGYPELMDNFIQSNPGLKSRIPFVLTFRDYTPVELLEITKLEAGKRGFKVTPDTMRMLKNKFETLVNIPDLGNGRFCRNLVEAGILNYADRVYGDHGSGKKDYILSEADFKAAFEIQQFKEVKTIGF